jgi:two-component system, NarL family, response regulator NreC
MVRKDDIEILSIYQSDLSKREIEILKLIIYGLENKAIARKLFISVKTVEFHKENLKQKLGIKTNKELYNLNSDKIDIAN